MIDGGGIFGGTAGLCGRENDVALDGDNGGGREGARVAEGCEEPCAGSRVLRLLKPTTEEGRLVFTDGGCGGGANGGGSFGGSDVELETDVELELIIFESAFSCGSSLPSSGSCALGTMSERNSRSSVDRARDLRSDPTLLPREKRFRKRETADGAGVTVGITTSGVVNELATGDEGATAAGTRAGEASRLPGAGDLVLSTLERVDIGGDRGLSTLMSVAGPDDTLRFKNESNPPPGFLS